MSAYDFKHANELREVGHAPVGERAEKTESLPKDKPASETPKTYELVRSASENALYFENYWVRGRGWVSVMSLGLVAGGGFFVWGIQILLPVLQQSIAEGAMFETTVGLLMLLVCAMAVTGSLTAAIRAFRIDLFGPKDVPLVFNRKTRKVYKFIQNMPTRDLSSPKAIVKYWLTAFQPWPMLLIEYDWDCLEAEYFEKTSLQGNVVQTINILQLIVKESPTSDTVIGTISLASPFMVGKQMAYNLWEHIRRYMEQHGPILNPGDQPAPPYPTNLLQSANTMTKGGWVLALVACWWAIDMIIEHGAIMSGVPYLKGVSNFEDTMVFMCLLFAGPVMLAIIFNWLAFKWGKDIELPQELQADAGAMLDLKRIAAIANGQFVPEAEPAAPAAPSFKGSSRKSGKHR